MKRTRPLLFVALATGVHFIVSFPLFLYVIGRGLADFGELRGPTVSESLANSLATVLLAPFSLADRLIPADWFSGKWGYVLLLLNSLVWGLLIWVAFSVYRRWQFSRRTG